MTPIKKLLGLVVIAAFIAVWLFLASDSKKIEHIEDTNGSDNYALEVITNENVELMDYGAKGFSITTDGVTGRERYSSKKYSGVTQVYGAMSLGNTYTIYINYFDVSDGNAALFLTMDDKIVCEFAPNQGSQSFTVENAKGSFVSLRLAGESAKFKLDIN